MLGEQSREVLAPGPSGGVGVDDRDDALVVLLGVGGQLGRDPVVGGFREDRYEIQVAVPPGEVPPSPLYDIVPSADTSGHTTLGVSTDGGALYDVLGVLAARAVPLVSVAQVPPDLEEVFVRLVGADR